MEMRTAASAALIYCEQVGEPPVPVTARIEWRPDGTIQPRLYWTPDGSCYQVKHISERTPIAFLKSRGEGLRLKIRAEAMEQPEPNDDFPAAQSETYLYFADNWFCGKNIVDERYVHTGKEFIPVTMDVFPNCEYELVSFVVKGTRYRIERTVSIEPHGNFSVGGVGMRHKVEARPVGAHDEKDANRSLSARRQASLYFEINKWFVMVKR